MTLETDATQTDLFCIAERINPRRAFLFVSTILGRHIPVDPIEHSKALEILSRGVDAHLGSGFAMVMGFAETAIGLGASIHAGLVDLNPDHNIGFLPTTRFAPDEASKWFEIEEKHSHAVQHIILKPTWDTLLNGVDTSLVMVDDETTSGATFAALAQALKEQGLVFEHIILVTLTDWSNGQAAAQVGSIYPKATISTVSLQQGRWRWEQNETVPQKRLPASISPACSLWTPPRGGLFTTPRAGYLSRGESTSGTELLSALLANGLRPVNSKDRLLVVGAGENVWASMRVAEAFAYLNIFTRFITTTRSPIEMGEVIRQKIVFPDHYGVGFEMYMHNVDPGDWDRILLFNETGLQGVPEVLRRALGQFDLIGPEGTVTWIDNE